MKLLSKIRDIPYFLAAAASVLSAVPAKAQQGGQTIGGQAEALKQDVTQVGGLLVVGGALVGVVMLVTGLMKLKQAADTQGNQVKYGEGLWRIGVGAGLIGLGAFSGMLTQTLGISDGSAGIQMDAQF